ncbi:hypothetical protein [Kitasatospora sp. LaBMicrA B282]|uniref:hypothetical protein n=1 Tax=Kitasatospora sp. LaBMicrA B282 TaxID=3420949 RepID=UPI003D0994F0
MNTIPDLPLLKRIPPPVRTALVWTVVVLYPVVLLYAVGRARTASVEFLTVPDPVRPYPAPYLLPRQGGQGGAALSYPLLATLLPAVLLRRRPLLGLSLMTGGAFLAVVSLRAWSYTLPQCVLLAVAVGLVTLSGRAAPRSPPPC